MANRKQLAKRMAMAFIAAGPLGPGDAQQDAAVLPFQMLRMVKLQFPEATEADFEAMCHEIVRVKGWPSSKRVWEALVFGAVEQLCEEVFEEKVRAGEAVREIAPLTGETVYRWLR